MTTSDHDRQTNQTDRDLGGLRPSDLPSPPQTALALIRACAADAFDVEHVAGLVASDPTLTAELLRLVNSPFFGLGREVTSVKRAVTVLGRRALRNRVLCLSVRDALADDTPAELDIAAYWEDALRRAVAARLISERVGGDPDDAFTAGLLADFGLLVLFHLYPFRATEWPDLRGLTPEQRQPVELRYFGATHDRVVGLLAASWGLPDDLVEALGAHHDPETMEPGSDAGRMAATLHAADWFAAVYAGDNHGPTLERCRRCLADEFGLDAAHSDALLAEVPAQAEAAARALGLGLPEHIDFEEILRRANVRLAEDNLSYQELAWRLEKTLHERDRLAAELDLELQRARKIQRGLLPGASTSIPVYGCNVAARQLSGDFYDYFPLPDGRIYFNLADVSGKGITAALLMAKVSSLFRCLGKEMDDPATLLARINSELCETSRFGMFVTMIAGLYNPRSGSVRLVNAGHPPALRVASDGNVQRFGAQAPPLGIDPAARPVEQCFTLGRASLYLFSDGVTERRGPTDEAMGIEGIENILVELAAQAPRQRVHAVVDRVLALQSDPNDDMTVLLVEG